MASKFELPIRIDIKPSKWLIAGIVIAHLGAIIITLLVHLALWVKAVMVIMVCTSLVHCLRVYLWQNTPSSPVALLLNNMDEWLLTFAQGETVEVVLRPGAFVHPLLIVLSFKYKMFFPSVILTPDVVDQDVLRRLRVRLRLKRSARS